MSSAKRLWPEDVVGHGFRVVREADYDALAAECQRLREALVLAVEGAQIMQSLIDNIEAKGNYSAESTVVFLQQAIGYLLPARAALAGSKEEE